jgi:pimeloyl-ACP methyl ester carboxylesterase
MYVVHDGPRDAPPLLLIHGSGAAGSTWGPVVPALAGRHHVIRVDLPGCGQSPPAASYAVPAQAARVAALLDELGLRQVLVAGHSSGGYLATALAEQRPELVGALALVSTGPSPGALLPQPAVLRALLAPPLGPLIWARRSDALIRKGLRVTCNLPVELPDGVVTDVRRIRYRTFRAVMRCNGAYIAERPVPERLVDLGVPVLAVFGTADPRWDPASVRDYGIVPGVRIERLPGVGHLPMFEAPEPLAATLLAFAAVVGDTRRA